MTYTFQAEMHVTFKDRPDPSVFSVVVVADHAATVIEKGPAIMMRRYYNGEAVKVEFFGVRFKDRVELVIP